MTTKKLTAKIDPKSDFDAVYAQNSKRGYDKPYYFEPPFGRSPLFNPGETRDSKPEPTKPLKK